MMRWEARPAYWFALGIVVVASASLSIAAVGPTAKINTAAVTCGGSWVDGGRDLSDVAIDGGYPVTQITVGQADLTYWVTNTNAGAVYLGGSDVQPDNAPCIASSGCADDQFSGDTRRGTLYCTGTAATETRVLAGGPQ